MPGSQHTARRYHSPIRTERAAQTRQRIFEAAAKGFSHRGYHGTTLAQIAAEAGVAIDTVASTGSKAFLLLEAFRIRYAGEGDWRSILDKPFGRDLLAITDPDEALDAAIDFVATGHAASADLWYVVRATALIEPVVADGLTELMTLKEESFYATADWLLATGAIPTQVDTSQRRAFTTTLNLLMSAETYVQYVRDWHHTDDQYRTWLRRQIIDLRPS